MIFEKFLPWQFGKPKKPSLQSVHLVPTKLDLQLQTPLELHVIADDPEELHPHSENNLNILNN